MYLGKVDLFHWKVTPKDVSDCVWVDDDDDYDDYDDDDDDDQYDEYDDAVTGAVMVTDVGTDTDMLHFSTHNFALYSLI